MPPLPYSMQDSFHNPPYYIVGIPPHPLLYAGNLHFFIIIPRPLYLKGLHLSLYPLSSGEGKNSGLQKPQTFAGFGIAGRRDVLFIFASLIGGALNSRKISRQPIKKIRRRPALPEHRKSRGGCDFFF